jgi:hypothetical protein
VPQIRAYTHTLVPVSCFGEITSRRRAWKRKALRIKFFPKKREINEHFMI